MKKSTISYSIFDELPQVEKFIGCIPLRYGSFFIGFYGLGSGCIGLAIIILYALGAFNFVTYLLGEPNEDTKKAFIVVMGLLALISTVKNIILMFGSMMNSKELIKTFVWISFITNLAVIGLVTAVPLLCVFGKKKCLLNAFSWFVTMFASTFFFIFLCVWTYFLIVVNSFRMTMY